MQHQSLWGILVSLAHLWWLSRNTNERTNGVITGKTGKRKMGFDWVWSARSKHLGDRNVRGSLWGLSQKFGLRVGR